MIFDLLSGVEIKTNSDKSFVKTTEFGHQSTLKTRPYELLKTNDKSVGLAECFPIPVSERTDIGRDTVAALEWQYFRNKHRSGKRLRINGETMMTIGKKTMPKKDRTDTMVSRKKLIFFSFYYRTQRYDQQSNLNVGIHSGHIEHFGFPDKYVAIRIVFIRNF